MKLGTMPLPVDVQTLPLYLWEKARGTPFDVDADLHTLLPWARAATLLFWLMLLAYVWAIARAVGGTRAALVAVAFVACEPTLVAHAGLATTDIALTACLLGLLYHFKVSREARGWRRTLWPAFWFALAVLAKASGMVFGGLCLLVIEGDRCGWWRRREEGGPTFRESLRDLIRIGAIGMGLVFVYCGSDWKPQASWVAWAHRLPEGPFASTMVWLSENLRVFSNAGDALARQIGHNLRGHGAYLLGHSDSRALWYYFPVVLTIKLTLPLLAAPLVLAGLRRLSPRQTPWYDNWALLCAGTLLVFSLNCRVQIGIRFMFPLVALATAGLAAGLVRALDGLPRLRRAAGVAAGGLLGWTIVGALAAWPHGLCYINPLWGDMADGYHLVSDSNFDWSQGVPELARKRQREGWDNLDVIYYGTDTALRGLPVRELRLVALPIGSPQDFERLVRGRRVAVSTTALCSSLKAPQLAHARAALRAREPVDRTMCFLVYDFTEGNSMEILAEP
jgi:4-amino-4-deoxy-L-arabinose transferase-like glycosyltransferase